MSNPSKPQCAFRKHAVSSDQASLEDEDGRLSMLRKQVFFP